MGGLGAARIGDKVAHGGGGGAGAAATAGGSGSASGGGGDVLEGSTNVIIEHQPAARAGVDHATCDHGHPPTLVAEGSSTVFVNGQPLGRLGDPAQCAAQVRSSATTVVIGGGTTSAADVGAADTQRAPAFMLVDFPGVAGAPQAAVAGGHGAVAPPAASSPKAGAAAAATHGGHAPPITRPPKRPALQGRAANSPNRYVRAAGAYEGTPYDLNWRTDGDAADGTQGIDCSGLVGHVYGLDNANGVPMTTGQINDALSQPGSGFTRLPPGTTPQTGDVLMWPGHTGIAVDPTTLVHAPQTGAGVEENITEWVRPDAPTIFRPDPSVYPP